MALFSSSFDMLCLLFASSPQLTIGSIDAMDLGVETSGLPPDFRPLRKAARAALYDRRRQSLQLRKRIQCGHYMQGRRGWRSPATIADFPTRDAELPRLVGQVLLD